MKTIISFILTATVTLTLQAATVVITGADINGDDVIASGTVDGNPAQVHVWLSHLNSLSTLAAKKTYVAQQLKLSADATAKPATSSTFNGSVTVP